MGFIHRVRLGFICIFEPKQQIAKHVQKQTGGASDLLLCQKLGEKKNQIAPHFLLIFVLLENTGLFVNKNVPYINGVGLSLLI